MSIRPTPRFVLPSLFALILFFGMCLALFQFTEVDSAIANSLRGLVPAGLKDVLRPFRAPQVLDFEPGALTKDVPPNSSISITFLTSMAPSSGAIQMAPQIRGDWSWNGRTATFTPSETLPLSTTVNVTITREARSWIWRRAEKDFGWTFSTIAPPSIIETVPRQGSQFAYSKDRLAVTFNREMDQQSVEQRLKVDPPIENMKLLWEGKQLYIGGALKSSTQYKIFLPSGAKDSNYGLKIPHDFEWSFTTTQQYPYLAVINIGRYGVTQADKATTLKLRTVNVSRIDAALYKFDTATYLKTLGFTYDAWRTFKPVGDPLKTWALTLPQQLDQTITQDLQLDALPAGTYFLMTKSPEGVNDTQVIVSTKTALTLKRTTDQVLVWATNIADGAPAQNLSLNFYNSKGESVGTGVTDRDGLYQGTISSTKSDLHLIGTRDGDFAAVSDVWQSGIEAWRFDNINWQWDPQKKSYRVYVYTDRPIYRPGQTVFFRGIVRRDDDGQYSQPNEGTVVHVKVSDWQERTLYDKSLKTSAFGSLADAFEINPEAGLGSYQIVASIGEEEYSNEIQVEEYRKPEYSVAVQTNREAYVNGDTITATIRAYYFFGGAVAGASVRWTLYSNDYYFYWAGGDYDFGNAAEQRYYGYGKEVSSGNDTLNANGELVLKLPANILTEERSQIYTVEAEVTDAANQPQTAIAAAIVHRGNFYIGARPTNYVAERGKESRYDVQTLDTNGKALGRIPLQFAINLLSWNCRTTKDSNDKSVWKCNQVKTEIQSGNVTTDASGKAQLAFVPPRGGSFRLELRGADARSNRVLGESWVWVSDRAQFVAWEFQNNDRIALVLDKKQYSVGDTAQVLVQSPYAKSTALVTLERGKIITRQLVALDSNSATIPISITEGYFPNVYVSVLLIPQGGFPDGIPSFKMGLANIPIISTAKSLQVNLSAASQQYAPRDKAVFNIKTADSSGKPVSAEVSLSVVDKAVLALASNFGPDIVEAFYGKRDLAVKTSQSLTVYLARVNQREDIGGGGGAAEQARKDFPDIAFWSPSIVTDADGNARAEFPLPDNLTTWSAMANGVTAQTQVGKGTGETVVTKDLIVRPVLPRFVNVGDKLSFGAIVRNSTLQDKNVTVSLNATNVTAQSPMTRSVTIGAGQSTRIDWSVSVPQANALAAQYSPTSTIPLSTTIIMTARAGGASDAVQLSLPIEPFGEKRTVANAGQLDEAETRFSINVPSDATFSTIKLSTSPSVAAGLVDSLQYLTGFPYGCVEQTMSRFLPTVLVKQTLGKLNVRNPQIEKDLPAQVEDGLTRLYAYQHYDGGWGWWENDDSQAYESAFVLYGLAQAKKAGHAVDDKVIKKAIEFLRTPLVDTNDYNLKVYIAYSLEEAGQGDPGLARAMVDKQAQMSLYSRATLGLLLHAFNEDASAKTIVGGLEKQAIESAQQAHWEETQADLGRWEFYPGNGRTTATVLQAILAVDPQSPLAPKVVRYLMQNRLGGYWRTTQETAQTIIALTDYLAFSGELNASFSYEVFVDGASTGKYTIGNSNISQQQSTTLRATPGNHEVRIVKTGTGRVYFASTMQYYASQEAIGPVKSLDGPNVTREYLDPVTDKSITSFRLGDMVRVKLTVDAPRESWYMMVTDPLPAGFESINYSLETSGVEPTGKSGFLSYWSRPDLRDDRAVFFTTYMWKGKHIYTYLIRATTSGTFRALPAEAAPMYEPDVFGRSGSVNFVVNP